MNFFRYLFIFLSKRAKGFDSKLLASGIDPKESLEKINALITWRQIIKTQGTRRSIDIS